MDIDKQEAQAIIAELTRMHDEAMSLLNEGRSVVDAYSDKAVSLKSRLAALKLDIKDAAKHETLLRRNTTKTQLEQNFFGPAVRSTAANFRMRSDTSPASRNWSRGLHEVESELSYVIYNLTKLINKTEI